MRAKEKNSIKALQRFDKRKKGGMEHVEFVLVIIGFLGNDFIRFEQNTVGNQLNRKPRKAIEEKERYTETAIRAFPTKHQKRSFFLILYATGVRSPEADVVVGHDNRLLLVVAVARGNR